MHNKILRNVIIILIFLIIILYIIIINITNTDSTDYSKEDRFSKDAATEQLNRNIEKVKLDEDYYAVKTCIDLYYSTINKLNSNSGASESIDYASIILELLNEDYINLYNLDKDKIYDVFENYKYTSFNIHEMYVKDNIGDNKIAYFVYGKEISEKEINNNYGYLVIFDTNNGTFSLSPYEYMKQKGYADANNLENIEINTDTIINKEHNTYSYIKISNEKIADNLFLDYKINAINDIQRAYDLLDKEYRDKRFSSFENFQKYVTENKEMINASLLNKYTVNEHEEYTEYICIDNYGKYYIFHETTPMNYTLMLDTYTIDTPEFIEKYNSSNNKTKIAMNVEKFISMINSKDYETAYNKLDSGFRNNYFKTQEDFENYIKNTFFENNKAEYSTCEEKSGIYTIDVTLINYATYVGYITPSTPMVEKTFIMKLKEGTDFVMSFNVNE